MTDVNAVPLDTRDWTVAIRVKPLASRVLAVAITRVEGTWKAYCAAVPGISYEEEWQLVLERGDKLPVKVAQAIFPEFAGIPYTR